MTVEEEEEVRPLDPLPPRGRRETGDGEYVLRGGGVKGEGGVPGERVTMSPVPEESERCHERDRVGGGVVSELDVTVDGDVEGGPLG